MPAYSFAPLIGIRLSPIAGDTHQILPLPKHLQTPLTISKDGTLEGIKSGGRSAIIIGDENQVYRVKGCKPSGIPHPDSVDPEGGQIAIRAQAEIRTVPAINEVLSARGFKPAYTPAGWWEYGLSYVSPYRNAPEPLQASIFQVYGITRLWEVLDSLAPTTELLRRLTTPVFGYQWMGRTHMMPVEAYENMPPEFKNFTSSCAKWAGYLLRTMHDAGWTWDTKRDGTNAHLENFIFLSEDGKNLELGIVDLSDAQTWPDSLERSAVIQFEYNRLSHGPSFWKNAFKKGYEGASLPSIDVDEMLAAQQAIHG